MPARRISFRDQRYSQSGFARRIFHLAMLAAAIWFLGFLFFAAAIPAKVANPTEPVDAVIVLTGGSERLLEGFSLLGQGASRNILISGVAGDVTMADLLARIAADQRPPAELLSCCVTLGYVAQSTEGNAKESLRWLQDRGLKSARLVTANYHMNRSLLEFRRAMPDIRIVPHPVFPEEVRDPYWFLNPRTDLLLINEYHKYLGAFARATFDDLSRRTGSLRAKISGLFS